MTLKACLTSVLCLSKAMQYAIWLHVFVQLSFHGLCTVQDIIFLLVIISLTQHNNRSNSINFLSKLKETDEFVFFSFTFVYINEGW